MKEKSQYEIFNDYWHSDGGTFYKKIEFSIDNCSFASDIYWADPNIIFHDIAVDKYLPLAKTVIPVYTNHPYPRIFVHHNLTRKYKDIFEYVVTHEIGHLWLYEILGTKAEFTGHELEAWADLFSCIFFMKYRNVEDLDQFNKTLNYSVNIQGKLYKLPLEGGIHNYDKKKEEIEALVAKSEASRLSDNPRIFLIANSIEPTLDAMGDIFK